MPAQMVLLVVLAVTITLAAGETGYPFPIAKPGCNDSCGNMSIPYPFGTTKDCSLNSTFFLHCFDNNNTASLGARTTPMTEIMLLSGEVRVLLYISHLCYTSDREIRPGTILRSGFDAGLTYTLSQSENIFTVVGCNASAYIINNEGKQFTTAGCNTTCGRLEDVVNGTCEGNGCCQNSLPRRTRALNIVLDSNGNHSSTSFNPCNSAFVVEQAAYNFSSADFTLPPDVPIPRKPVIFDWAIGSAGCSAAQNQPGFLCGENSVCVDYDNGGYRCNCSDGFRGNPYLPNGCQDIDECTLNNPCTVGCINSRGSFSCSPCQTGYEGDGYSDGTGCKLLSSISRRFEKILRIALGTSLGFIAILLLGGGLHFILQKRKLNQLRKKYYKENGGFTLQQILSRHERQLNSFKRYTADELKKATHSYDESRILGKGGQGTVYKGELADNTIVAIKKSNVIEKSQVDSFINEIVILSQTNHRNVVKLLGCCLETEIPMLVYEYITNGTLSDYIRKDGTPQMPWHTRVRIAAETAGAISYLHSAAAIPIIHRDIKTANILLDIGYTAKVSDFGISKLSHVDKTSLATNVVGTPGYLDPEYRSSFMLSEKSDVYSFGVVLLELLTGARAFDDGRTEEDKSLAFYFTACMKEGRLDDIVDENLKKQAKATQLEEFASLAARCLYERGEDRPSMNEVARVLERMAKRETDHPWVAIDLNDEQETEVLVDGPVRSTGTSNATNLTNKDGN